jgi:hypothetical protein
MRNGSIFIRNAREFFGMECMTFAEAAPPAVLLIEGFLLHTAPMLAAHLELESR